MDDAQLTPQPAGGRRGPSAGGGRRRPAARPVAALPVRAGLPRVHRAPTPPRRGASLAAVAFDLVVLDVMMPGESGLELAECAAPQGARGADPDADRPRRAGRPRRRLRARRRRLPAQALRPARAGAPHPHHPPPRRRRPRRCWRRRRCSSAPAGSTPSGRSCAGRRARCGSPAARRRCSTALARRPGDVLSREEIAAALGMPEAGERAIDVQVTRLRRKIEPDPREPRFLHTVRHRGYVLRPGS